MLGLRFQLETEERSAAGLQAEDNEFPDKRMMKNNPEHQGVNVSAHNGPIDGPKSLTAVKCHAPNPFSLHTGFFSSEYPIRYGKREQCALIEQRGGGDSFSYTTVKMTSH